LDAVYINGPFLPGFSRESRSPAVTKSGTLYYPAWLAYACGLAEEAGFECVLLDAIADKINFEGALKSVTNNNPKIVVVGTSTPSIQADLDFGKAIKEMNPSCLLVLVGTHASSMAEQIVVNNNFVDIIARREYDFTVLNILKAIRDRQDWKNISGITYLDNGIAISNKDTPYIADLDTLPFVSKVYAKHLTIKNYYYGHVRYPMVSIFTSRGCDARCSYCLYPQTMFGNFRERSPKNIAEEFLWIAENLPQVKEILVDDDTFTMNKAHAQQVARELIKNKNKILWTCEARATLDYETLKLMKDAGCRLIVTGFESVSQLVLNKVNKNVKMSEVNQFVSAAEDVGLKIHACFMAGNPGDTIETLNETLEWALQQKSFDTAQFFPLQVYPGTKAYTEAQDNGYLKKQAFRQWITPAGMHNMTIIQNDRGLTFQECLDFCDIARRKFYLRPSYITKKLIQGLFSPQELKKNIIGFFKIYKYLFKRVSNEIS
jgi:anaerobic magnesium-protoporphyrin IX monomethyl ester cyclase